MKVKRAALSAKHPREMEWGFGVGRIRICLERGRKKKGGKNIGIFFLKRENVPDEIAYLFFNPPFCAVHGASGPEPSYQKVNSGFEKYVHPAPFQCKLASNPSGGIIDGLTIAYETWGQLNSARSNAILLHTGLSASSHAASHEVSMNVSIQP